MNEEKKIDSLSVRCDQRLKLDAEGCAEAVGITLSAYVLIAIQEKVNRDRVIYEALHNVFGNAKKDHATPCNSLNCGEGYNQ